MGLFARLKKLFHRKEKEIKLGIALGSGGSKGMAHLGALKAFEEAGLQFSYVAGTSIGSIVGALYAHGYSSDDMAGIISSLNRKEFAKNFRPFSDMGFAEEFLGQYLEADFASLPKPFACWATDVETNEGKLFREGNLLRACTASSAMPPIFRSVEIDGRKYCDGAFTNAIPADVVKEMGADLVVGIDLSAYVKSDSEKGMLSRLLGSALSYLTPVTYVENNKSRGYDAAAVMLRPNLEGFMATDVSVEAMDRMFELGYEEAKSHIEEIKLAIQALREQK